jgi:arylsulfatase A-like enzyme
LSSAPNILWIVSDHQIHASKPPGLDAFPLQSRLSLLGIEFKRAYSVLPVCSPARASMLTGLYPHAHGLTENDGRFGGREGLDSSDWMIHHALQHAGYRCGWFGKWHVNNHKSAIDYGFEGFSMPGYGYPYASDAYREYLQRADLSEPVARIEIAGESGLTVGSEVRMTHAKSWFDYESGVACLAGSARAHEACFVADEARRWIESVDGQPFFARVDTWGPHPPYLLAKPFHGMLDDRAIELPANFNSELEFRPRHHRDYRDYWRSTLGLDTGGWRRMYQRALEHVILVETALCDLLEKIDLDNTLVIFNCDHGDAVGSNGGVANKGGLMVEATMQIPLLIAGPGISGGQIRGQLVSQLDLVPTILEICGIDAESPLHGMSLAPLIGDDSSAWRQGLMTQHYGLHEPIQQRAWYQQQWKLVMQPDGYRELYDLEHDAGELENLAGLPQYQQKLGSLQQQLARAMSDVSDTSLLPFDELAV